MPISNSQISTFTLLRFKGMDNMFWIFSQMQLSKKEFAKVPGLQFHKLLGSGSNDGFGRLMNPNVYAFHGVWDSEDAANDYFNTSEHFNSFKKRSDEIYTVYLHSLKAHGTWSGSNPYLSIDSSPKGAIVVVTRATIKLKYIAKFWNYVPSVSKQVAAQNGNLLSIGIGEYPWFMQATFSIWQDMESMRSYAYQNKHHAEVIRKTRELGWYSEELFANFQPYKTTGTWNQKELLNF